MDLGDIIDPTEVQILAAADGTDLLLRFHQAEPSRTVTIRLPLHGADRLRGRLAETLRSLGLAADDTPHTAGTAD